MKKVVWISWIITSLLGAESYRAVIHNLNRSLKLQSAQAMQQAASALADAESGRALPTLDASIRGVHLRTQPMFRGLPAPLPPAIPMGGKNRVEAALTLRYPLFSGFAIGASIDKARLRREQAALRVTDLRRNLALGATRLYAAAVALRHTEAAQSEARHAIAQAYTKAKGMRDAGLIDEASLSTIEAQAYEMDAQITRTRTQYRQTLARLGQLTRRDLRSVDAHSFALPNPSQKKILSTALHSRADLVALRKSAQMSQQDIRLAKSTFMPQVGLEAALKHEGETLGSLGDTQTDRSYVAIGATWNLFNGGSDTARLEAARCKALAAQSDVREYRAVIRMEIGNAFEELRALRAQYRAFKKARVARTASLKKIEGKFDHQLASADELSRAIADLAAARAALAAQGATIEAQKATLWLMAGWGTFRRAVRR